LKSFALIGAAGYIAPRHLNAIKETGHRLVAAIDPHDSVGVLDSYFPDTHFFTEFERFDRFLEKRRRSGEPLDYVTIASPNYLHDAHCRFAMRLGADAICEKPVVIKPWNIDALRAIEAESGRRIYTILQLRLHPAIVELRDRIAARRAEAADHRFEVRLDYVTSRGPWYHRSWKGSDEKAGGIVTNIGVHFFDMLLWVFGGPGSIEASSIGPTRASGVLRLDAADVTWSLSIDAADLPAEAAAAGQRTFRAITVDGEAVEFSEGFTNLHTLSYARILAGNGFGLADARPSIDLVHRIREAAAA
jgi:UDP-N-acetyl-2-amino-2-deoxyglucuronate dehydrogenase